MIRRALPPALALLAFAAPASAQSVNTGPGCAPGTTCTVGTITGQAANSFELNNVSSSFTVPTLIPDKSDPTTGFGSNGPGAPVAVVAGLRVTQWISAGPLEYQDVIANTASGFRLVQVDASATAPTLIPNRSDLKAGIGADAAGDVSLISNVSTVATETLRAKSGVVVIMPKTVATLPACVSGLDGARSFVTDATATTFASSVAGSGANHVPVYCDGSGTPTWKIG